MSDDDLEGRLRKAAAEDAASAARLEEFLREYSADAVAVLRDKGADLAAERRLEHYLYLPDERAAEAIANELRGEGFDAEVRTPLPGIDEWLVLVAHQLVLDEQKFLAARARLGEIAHAHGGDYDGWETTTA